MKKRLNRVFGTFLLAVVILLQTYACKTETEQAAPIKRAGPVAIAGTNEHFGNAPFEVELKASGPDVRGDGESIFRWDLDDGYYAEGDSIRHTFAAPGTYMVTLTITDKDGRTDSDTVIIIVN